MLTRAAPAIDRALSSVMTQGQLAQFMGAVAKCSMPLEQRAPATFTNDSAPFGPGGDKGGVYTEPPGWNPQDYGDLFPQVTNNNNTFVDITNNSSYRAGDWFSNYYAGPNYDLRTTLNQTMNQYFAENHYAGNTINVAGNTSTTNLTTNNLTTQNINTTNINNFPVTGGPSGPQGDRGLDGKQGAPGQAGAPGRDGAVIVVGNQFDPTAILREIARLNQFVAQLANDFLALKLALQNIQATPANITFDPDTCSLNPETVNIQVSIPGL